MKLKRAKAYRKLMHQYEIQFGFREPYQVLLDSAILEDAYRFKIDVIPRLEGVLQGKIKPMITQCSMRHLYNATPKNDALINQAKAFERRRCNHHELEHPLSSLKCLSEVVDPKGGSTNKHRYIVASQDVELRVHMRKIAGVPLVYISKSVMLLEPMNTATEEQREREERSKFRLGLKGQRNPDAGHKRKREEEQGSGSIEAESTGDARLQKKKKQKGGPKEPNPLSMKKAKKTEASMEGSITKTSSDKDRKQRPTSDAAETSVPDDEASGPRKRKRKHKPKGDGGAVITTDGEVAPS